VTQYQTENVVGGLVLLIVLLLVVVLIRRVTGGSALDAVSEELALSGSAADHAGALEVGLRSIRGARVEQRVPGQFVLVVRRSPNWTLWFLPLFGLGFVLALVFSRPWHLAVTLYDAQDGARVRLAGETEHRTAERARAVVARLAADGSGGQ
jgi:hypothetical protein